MWRRLAALVVAVALLGTGCGPGAGDDTSTIDNFPRENITLTIWRAGNDSAGFADAVNEYRQLHENVSFNFRQVSPDSYEQELVEAIAAGQGPDLVTLPNAKIHAFEDKLEPMPAGFFGGSDLITTISAQYPQAVLADTLHGGKIFGLPFSISGLVLITNTNLVQAEFNRRIQAELPTNNLFFRAPVDWNEVIDLTKVLTKKTGDQISEAGIALGTTNNIPNVADIIAALMLQQGVKMVTADGKDAAYHLPDAKDSTYYPGPAVLDFLKGFSNPASPHYSWNAQKPAAVHEFINGRLAMMIGYPSIVPYLAQRNPGLGISLAPLPQIPNAFTIVDFAGDYRIEAVTKTSRYPQVAWDFLAKMVNIGLPLYLETVGGPSAVKQFAPTTTVAERAWRTDAPLLQVPTMRSWYKGSDPDQANQLLVQSFDRVLQGKSARESLTEAAAAFSRLLNSGSS